MKAYGAETVRSGGLAGLHDDRAALAATRASGDQRDAHAQDRSRRGARVDQPGERRHPRDDGDRPGPREQPVQPALAGAPPAGIDLQDVRARRRGRARARPVLDLLRLRAVHVPPELGRELRRRELVVREDLRLELHRLDVGRAGDAPLGQHRLRAADARRRRAAGRLDGPPARRAHAARRPRAVRPRDGPRLGRRLAARHGLGLRDARRRRHLHGADRDPQGDPPAASRTTAGPRITGACASSPTASRPSSRASSRTTSATGRGRGGARPARCREDRNDRRARGRLVRRATRRASRPPSGWATRAARCR